MDKYASVPYALYAYNTANESTMRSTFTERKINDYITGVEAVQAFFARPECVANWELVRSRRISASLKLMINKTYHETEKQPELDKYLLSRLQKLHQQKSFKYRELPVKVLARIAKIWIRNI